MRHKDRDPLQKEPSRDLFRRGISRLRRLILPSSQGLQIGDNFVTAKDDGSGNTDPFWQRADGTESNLIDDVAAHDYDTHSGGVPFAELEYDDATSDPLIDADSASDGTEGSAARKDHVHPKHHAKYLDSEAISAVEGEATLDLTGDVTIDGAKSLSVDVINEKDSAAGVTIDGVQMKDNFVVVPSGAGMNSIGSIDLKIDSDNNSAAEKLRILKDAGTEIAVFHEDGSLDIDVINEETAAAGVTIDSVLLKDGVVTVGDVAFDDATSDPLPADSTSAADGSENSVARKDHRHFATAATASVQGIAELATAAETSTGTDTARVVPVVALPIQIQDSKYSFAADAEASDTYKITMTPTVAAYATGQAFHFKANTINTGAATLEVEALGAKTIKKNHDQDLANSDIEAGQIVTVIYDGTNFQMQSQIANAGAGGNSLDSAYDQGGAGSGRTITADNGVVSIQNATGTQAVLETKLPGDASSRWLVEAGGGMKWGDGTGQDISLLRIAANELGLASGDTFSTVTLKANTIDERTGGVGVTIDTAQIKDNGIVFVEAADHPIAAAATKGQIWVKTATPNELWFTDDAGTDVELGAGGGGGQDLDADTLWAAAGDLVKGTGNDTADILSIGADHTVLVSNGSVPSYSAAPPLANIADTGDTNRITLATSNPHVTLGGGGGVRLNNFAAVRGDPATTDAAGLFRVVATVTDTAAGIKAEPTMTGSGNSKTITGLTGAASSQVTGTGTAATGLSYTYVLQATGANSKATGIQVNGAVVVQANTVDEFTGIRVDGITAVSNSGTITDTYGIRIRSQNVTGMTQTNIYGFKIENQTAGTNVYPLFVDGNSDNQDHYSVHQPSIVLFKAITAGDDFMGLTTAAKAGDGVMGWGDAATAPDEVTNPTGGLILWAAAGALFGIGSSGTKTTIAAAEPHCPKCGKDAVLEWSNKGQRWHLQVCMWCYGKSGGAGVIKQESNART